MSASSREIADDGPVPTRAPAAPAVILSGLRVPFKRFCLGPVSFTLGSGERVALLGTNGAGKSTLINALGGRVLDYEGSIVSAGHELRTVLPHARAWVGVLPERVVAYDYMTVGDYLGLHERFYPNWDPDRARDLVTRLQLDVGARMTTLSKGTRVKVAFVAVESYRPPLLLLDEPTSGLDPLVRETLLECIRESLDADSSRTLLFSTHILEDVVTIAQRVLVLRDGALALDVAMNELAAGHGSPLQALREGIRATS